MMLTFLISSSSNYFKPPKQRINIMGKLIKLFDEKAEKPKTVKPKTVKPKTEAEKNSGMKYMVRSNTYKASNVYFDCDTEQAYSYDWWCFVSRINGVLVFNDHNYSPSTNKQQSKVKSLLNALGLEYFRVNTRYSLGPIGRTGLERSIEALESENAELTELINKKRSRKTKNIRRAHKIKLNLEQIKKIQKIMNYKSDKPKTVKNTERYWV